MPAADVRLAPGDTFPPRSLTTLGGASVAIPEAGRSVHLQLRRFAGCPICNLHLRSFQRRVGEVRDAGVREVIVFHSSEEELRRYQAELPFDVIADPTKELYREFGVESSRTAMRSARLLAVMPRVMGGALPGLLRGRRPPSAPTGGTLGLPADILIDATGRVAAVKYGEHAYDQWSVDELLALVTPVAAASGSASPSSGASLG